MLRLRATYLSGDFAQYWELLVKRDQQRRYAAGAWKPASNAVAK